MSTKNAKLSVTLFFGFDVTGKSVYYDLRRTVRSCLTMNVKASVVHVEGGFIEVSFAGLELIIEERSGLINATHLCTQKGKALAEYDESERRKILKLEDASLVKDMNDNTRFPGTYFHPALLLDLAAWLAPETYVFVAHLINVSHSRQIVFLESATPTLSEATFDFGNNRRGSDLVVNSYGFFETFNFCRRHGKTLNDFELRNSDVSLVEYFHAMGMYKYSHERVEINDVYYVHPLLFLRLVAWVDPENYMKLVHLVFVYDKIPAKALFHLQIQTTTLLSRVKSLVDTHKTTRTEHELELDRMRQELQSEVKRERLAQEEALARETQMARALARVEEKFELLERERAKGQMEPETNMVRWRRSILWGSVPFVVYFGFEAIWALLQCDSLMEL